MRTDLPVPVVRCWRHRFRLHAYVNDGCALEGMAYFLAELRDPGVGPFPQYQITRQFVLLDDGRFVIWGRRLGAWMDPEPADEWLTRSVFDVAERELEGRRRRGRFVAVASSGRSPTQSAAGNPVAAPVHVDGPVGGSILWLHRGSQHFTPSGPHPVLGRGLAAALGTIARSPRPLTAVWPLVCPERYGTTVVSFARAVRRNRGTGGRRACQARP